MGCFKSKPDKSERDTQIKSITDIQNKTEIQIKNISEIQSKTDIQTKMVDKSQNRYTTTTINGYSMIVPQNISPEEVRVLFEEYLEREENALQ